MSKRTIVHVHQQRIRQNIHLDAADRLPPVIVRRGKQRHYTDRAEIRLGGKLVGVFHYSPDKPLDCGARVWLELEPGAEVAA
jgi:hypothetical protein